MGASYVASSHFPLYSFLSHCAPSPLTRPSLLPKTSLSLFDLAMAVAWFTSFGHMRRSVMLWGGRLGGAQLCCKSLAGGGRCVGECKGPLLTVANDHFSQRNWVPTSSSWHSRQNGTLCSQRKCLDYRHYFYTKTANFASGSEPNDTLFWDNNLEFILVAKNIFQQLTICICLKSFATSHIFSIPSMNW